MISGSNFYVQGIVPGASSEVVFDGKEVVDFKRFSEPLSSEEKKQRFKGREVSVSFGHAPIQDQVPKRLPAGFQRTQYFTNRYDYNARGLNARFSRAFNIGLTRLEDELGKTLESSATSGCKDSKIQMAARAIVKKFGEALEKRLGEEFSLERGESKNTASEKKRFLDTVTSELGNTDASALLPALEEQFGHLAKDENVKKLLFDEVTTQLNGLKVEVAGKLRQLKLEECIPDLRKFKEEHQFSWGYEGTAELDLKDEEAIYQALQSESYEFGAGDAKKIESAEWRKKLRKIVSSHCEAVVMQDIVVKDKVLKLMNELSKECLIRKYPSFIKSLIEFNYQKKSEADELKNKYKSLCLIDRALKNIGNIPDDPLIVPLDTVYNELRFELTGIASDVKDYIKDKFDYEIMKNQKLPDALINELQQVDGVFGFGYRYATLSVDLKAGLSDQEIEDAENKIANILKGREYYLGRDVSIRYL